MITDLGLVPPGSTIRIPFHTFDSNDPSASVTTTGFAATDVEIFKDGSTTQRASDSGYTATIDFDSITGTHLLIIDLADNATAGFWSAGPEYLVQVASITVDAATINFWAARFRIGLPNAVLNTTIATLASQTSFTLTTGPAEDDALNGCVVYIHDVASAVQGGFAVVQDYTGSTKTVTLTAGTTFTAAATDNISVFPPSNAQWGGTVAYSATRGLAGTALPAAAADGAGGLPISDAGGLDLDAKLANTNEVTAARMGALTDWINGGRLDLIIDAVLSDTNAILVDTGTTLDGRIPAALVGGRMDANMGAISTDATAADNFETMLDGTGGQTLTLGKLYLTNSTGLAFEVNCTNTNGAPAVRWQSASNSGPVFDLPSTGTAGYSIQATSVNGVLLSGTTGNGLMIQSASGIPLLATSTNELTVGAAGLLGIYGTASGNGTTTTLVDTARTEATTDHWVGCKIRFLSGTNMGQERLITGFTPASDTITFAPAVNAATATSDLYELIPASRVDIHSILGTVSPAAAGSVAPDWGQVQNATATVSLTNTTVGIVSLVNTLTTYTGNTLQTGDSFARIGAAGAGLTDLGGFSTTAKAQIESEVDDALGGGTGTALTAIPWNAAWDAEVQSECSDALTAYGASTLTSSQVFTTAMTESYRSAGATGTLAQLCYEIIAHMGESSISSTTKTLKKLDGSTTAKTYTLDSATVPTSISETT